MYRIALKRFIMPIIILIGILMIALYILSTTRLHEKTPSRGVFVYSKEFDESAFS